MADAGAGRGAGQRGRAGIGEQVQHAHGTAGRADQRRRPVPVCGLFREQAGMLKIRRTDMEAQRAVAEGQLGDGLVILPVPAARAGADIACVRIGPCRVRTPALPDHLRVGPDQHDAAPAFQALAVRTVEKAVIPPCIGQYHSAYTSSMGEPLNSIPRWRHALAVMHRPRGVRLRKPICSR